MIDNIPVPIADTLTMPLKRKRVGEILVDKGVVSHDQVRIALIEQQQNGERLGSILVRLGFATEAVIRDVLSGALGHDSVALDRVLIDSEVVHLIPRNTARRFHLIALTYDASQATLTLAIADPFNVLALDQVRALFPKHVEIRRLLAGEVEIDRAIERFYSYELSIDGILQEIETGENNADGFNEISDEYSQPVVRLVDALLAQAVKHGASDVHFEPEHGFLRIRYRVDGVLRSIRSLHRNYWAAIAVRLKVMANMNIAETRAPQDGRISLTVSGRAIDFRVSSLPTTHGENIVLRVLDREKGIVALDQLGLPDDALHTLHQMMARPHGIILVTGPTGSGKTTTLYSMLNHLNSEQVNIMTLEDPVEYPLGMIRQTSINDTVQLSFANGVRSLLRQDPDIILIGEIRDTPTAEMAFQAAMTGHQVFSTVHTPSVIGTVPRLLELGILTDIMVGNIIGIVGQRLLRRLCPDCKQPYTPNRLERSILGLDDNADPVRIYRKIGCQACDHQGYKGRLALIELLQFDHDFDDLISRRATRRELYLTALAKGFRPLADDGIRRALEGSTSLDEVSRVVDLTDRISH